MAEMEVVFKTDQDYYPLSDINSNMNSWFPLKLNKASYLCSTVVVSCALKSGDPAQICLGSNYSQNYGYNMRVCPTLAFIRTGRMDTAVNVVLTGYQWSSVSNQWLTVTSWTAQLPPNVKNPVIPLAPSYSFAGGFWTYFQIALEHAYSEEGVAIDKGSTLVEVAGRIKMAV